MSPVHSPELRPGPGEEAAGAGDGAFTAAVADSSELVMKAGTSEEAVKAGTGTRTNASVVYNGYNKFTDSFKI